MLSTYQQVTEANIFAHALTARRSRVLRGADNCAKRGPGFGHHCWYISGFLSSLFLVANGSRASDTGSRLSNIFARFARLLQRKHDMEGSGPQHQPENILYTASWISNHKSNAVRNIPFHSIRC
jgi:hypothetical protein